MNEENRLLTDAELDAKMTERPAPRVTKEAIEARITDVDYTVLPDSTVTICSLKLDNGYSVRGESACVNPANFDREIGQRLAYDDAFRRLWPLFGFLLAEDQFRQRQSLSVETTFQERVEIEKRELDEKRQKLKCFIDSDTFLGLSYAEQDRLQQQMECMDAYSELLGRRIEAFARA